MPVIDLRDPEIREELGLMTETVSIPSQCSSGAANGRSRAETMRMIIDALSEHGPMTRLQLARALGRAKSGWLVAIFEQMAVEGAIVRGQMLLRNGLTAIVYGVEA